jgi:hypothetical protein
VAGGIGNTASGGFSTIGGGAFNRARNTQSTVSGGANNTASAANATIAGGFDNTATGTQSTIGGGSDNLADGNASTIGGGYFNQVLADFATIAGGGPTDPNNSPFTGNVVTDNHGTIGGGGNNQAGDDSSVTTNATFATVGGGQNNTASGANATVSGGENNIAAGDFSVAVGRNVRINADHDGAFLFGDQIAFLFNSVSANEFAARATGGVRFVTAVDGAGTPTAGAILPAGGGAWLALSDANLKDNFQPVDSLFILEQVAGMPITSWNYETQDPSIRHIGPMAQDFFAAFNLGEDERYISTIDADGVALAAIQGLYQRVEQQDGEITTLQQENDRLRTQLADIDARLTALEQGGAVVEASALPISPATFPWLVIGGMLAWFGRRKGRKQ